MTWDRRQFGSAVDPLRQSDLETLASDYGCPERWRRAKIEDAERPTDERERRLFAKAFRGDVVHAVIDRALGNDRIVVEHPSPRGPVRRIDRLPHRRAIERTVLADMAHRAGERELEGGRWTDIAADASVMVEAALLELDRRADEILLAESAFAVEIAGYWCVGTADCVYRRRHDGGVVLCDWKTGDVTKNSDPFKLSHGYQIGIYAEALRSGVWFDWCQREAVEAALAAGGEIWEEMVSRGRVVGEFPAEMYVVCLADTIPYVRKPRGKKVTRPEAAAFYNCQIGDTVKPEVGDPRGPAWYRATRTEDDLPRLEHSLRQIVGSVRLGRFIENIGSSTCGKCRFRDGCLNEGHGPKGDELVALQRATKGLDFDGHDALASDDEAA